MQKLQVFSLLKCCRSIFLALTIIFTGKIYGFEYKKAHISEVSQSGSSFLLEKGELEGVKKGQFARFIIRLNDDADLPYSQNLAIAECVQTQRAQSYWFVHKRLSKGQIVSGTNVEVILQNDWERGDKGLTSKTILKYGARQKLGKIQVDNSFDKELVSNDLSETDIETIENNFVSKSGPDYFEDFDTKTEKIDLADKSKLDSKLKKEKFKQNEFVSESEKTRTKTYPPQGGVNNFYSNNQTFSGEYHTEQIEMNLYHQRLEKDKYGKVIKDYDELKQKGYKLSENLSDTELQNRVDNASFISERDRLNLLASEVLSTEITAHYSRSESANSNYLTYDTVNESMGIGYQLHLASLSRNFKSWAIGIEYDQGNKYIDNGSQNVKVKEKNYSLDVSYYFIGNPLSIDKLTFYGGVSLGFGKGVMFDPIDGTRSDVEISHVYNPYIGTNYRFHAKSNNAAALGPGIGLRLTSESLGYQNPVTGNNITVKELKTTFIFSMYF